MPSAPEAAYDSMYRLIFWYKPTTKVSTDYYGFGDGTTQMSRKVYQESVNISTMIYSGKIFPSKIPAGLILICKYRFKTRVSYMSSLLQKNIETTSTFTPFIVLKTSYPIRDYIPSPLLTPKPFSFLANSPSPRSGIPGPPNTPP